MCEKILLNQMVIDYEQIFFHYGMEDEFEIPPGSASRETAWF